MQINSLHPSATSLSSPRPEPSDGLASRLAESVVPSSFADAPGGSLRDILARYDVQRISPRSFSEMLQRLRDAGHLNEAEFRELSLIRLDLDQAGLDPDEEVDLIAVLDKQFREQQEELNRVEKKSGTPLSAVDRKAAIGPLERQLEWLHKFAAIHQNRGAVDALA